MVLLYKTPAAEFRRFAQTLRATTRTCRTETEVIVVENTGEAYADRATNAEIAKLCGWTYIETPRNLGFAGGVALGVERARGELICLLNDDCWFPAPWLDQLVEPLVTDARVSTVGPALRGKGGALAPTSEDFVVGACFVMRRSEWDLVGGFDRRYFFGGEEGDYCALWNRLGRRVVILPDVEVRHDGGEAVTYWATPAVSRVKNVKHELFQAASDLYRSKWVNGPQRVVGSMLIGDERGRYLDEALAWIYPRVDRLVLVDDCSSDGTWEDLSRFAAEHDKVALYRHARRLFLANEQLARESLHMKTLKEAPTHVLTLDADEELSPSFDDARAGMLAAGGTFSFPIWHLWGDRQHRRVDSVWGKQTNIRLFEVKWNESQAYQQVRAHCGTAPAYAYRDQKVRPDVQVVHKGWMAARDVEAKMARDKLWDPSAVFERQDHWTAEPVVIGVVS